MKYVPATLFNYHINEDYFVSLKVLQRMVLMDALKTIIVYALECKLKIKWFDYITIHNIWQSPGPSVPYFASAYVFIGVLLAT